MIDEICVLRASSVNRRGRHGLANGGLNEDGSIRKMMCVTGPEWGLALFRVTCMETSLAFVVLAISKPSMYFSLI